MKRFLPKGIALVLVAGFLSGGEPVLAESPANPDNLQNRIDLAGPGETIVLKPGTYEGPLTIGKPVRLEASREGTVTLRNDSAQSAIRIEADRVAVADLRILDESVKEAPSVLVTGDQVKLEGLQIRTGSDGIAIRDADGGEVSRTAIEWGAEGVRTADKGNGIDLYNAHRVRLTGNVIRGVHDGIYIENSDYTAVEGNRIASSRYGVHCMYAIGTVIRDNEGDRNVTGAMVMATRQAEISGNTFAKQNENVHSQGILLYDAHDTTIAGNTVEGNRVGLYIELSSGNRIEINDIRYNFIGIQLLESSGNRIINNQFLGNVADTEAQDSQDNDLNDNYWDAFQGIDANGDGKSDIGYAMNPFFRELVSRRPAFQLFFQSPGMVFLEGLYQSGRRSWTTDRAPLMEPPVFAVPERRNFSDWKTGLAGMGLTAGSLAAILWTRRKSG